jgi:hypothetical protein
MTSFYLFRNQNGALHYARYDVCAFHVMLFQFQDDFTEETFNRIGADNGRKYQLETDQHKLTDHTLHNDSSFRTTLADHTTDDFGAIVRSPIIFPEQEACNVSRWPSNCSFS